MGQPTQAPEQYVIEPNIKHTYSTSDIKTDSFIQIVSDMHWTWIAGIFVCLVIGLTVVLILVSKLTPLGKMLTKAFNGLKAMFVALIKWKPKDK